jgi:predicted transcriptional regulator
MKISKEKRDKISEQILALLFQNTPKLLFTYHIAREIARDEEFVKELLQDLKNKGLIVEINKNPKGISYKKRARWKLSDKAYDAYKKHTSS